MNTPDHDARADKLATGLDRLARSLPHRPAPATLEARVLAAVAAPRLRGFDSWMPVWRGAFLSVGVGFAAASVWLLLPFSLGDAWVTLSDLFSQASERVTALGDAARVLSGMVSGALPDWLRVWGKLGLMVLAALYLATLAAGAVAWRWWQTDASVR